MEGGSSPSKQLEVVGRVGEHVEQIAFEMELHREMILVAMRLHKWSFGPSPSRTVLP